MKRKKWKILFIILAVIIAGLFLYIEYANRNSINMTGRQKILKAFYPLWMGFTKLTSKNIQQYYNVNNIPPQVSFYGLSAVLSNGQNFDFNQLKGKKVLLVNTASDCGYTNQYQELQTLYEADKSKLVILAFPSNDFKNQEKGTDEQIAQFCKINYQVDFPLMKKTGVIKSNDQSEVFKWLSDKNKNGWNNEQPVWNFSKYLVNESGILVAYFGPSVSPLSSEIKEALNNK